MDDLKPVARSVVVTGEQWESGLAIALAQVSDIRADVVFLFANDAYTASFAAILRQVRLLTRTPILLGCSSQGIIHDALELEGVPALSLLVLSLPGAALHAVRFSQEMVETCTTPLEWRAILPFSPEDLCAWLLFVDPFQLDCAGLIAGLYSAYPDIPMLGGLASGDSLEQRTYVFLNDEVFDDGGVGLALGGAYTILPLVSQGCEPIGETWTITKVQDDGLIATISNRPAYELLIDTFEGLSPALQQRAERNLLVGLAADEYQDTFERGSFLIRQLLDIDRRNGALAIGAFPKVGQTLQFQMRDAVTADLDLQALLSRVHSDLVDTVPIAALMCTCNGRGVALFGSPDHDAALLERELGPLPLCGLFCNGEIGPIGKRPFIHGFTASIALLMKKFA